MNGSRFNLQSTNPLMQAVYLLVGGVLLIGALLMGAILLAFVLGFALVFGAAFWVRLWWLRRKILKQAARTGVRPEASSGDIVGVEYTVVEDRDPNRVEEGDSGRTRQD